MSLEQILTRLENHDFELLAEASRTAVPRVQTLQAAITWSFDLCCEQERTLWLQASVFTDGFDLQAAEEVCTGAGIARKDVLEPVAGLVDKSVLIRTKDATVARVLDAGGHSPVRRAATGVIRPAEGLKRAWERGEASTPVNVAVVGGGPFWIGAEDSFDVLHEAPFEGDWDGEGERVQVGQSNPSPMKGSVATTSRVVRLLTVSVGIGRRVWPSRACRRGEQIGSTRTGEARR
ncbi:hypothetical protein [Kibdelosporangium aridum]|uniref:hypothetical protein n=1 Tax=Kibdelosporangium aridum TaxID=2030 RepID=UPI0035E9AE41